MRWLALAVVLCGCDRVFGLSHGDIPVDGAAPDAGCATPLGVDLDGDGIDDGCDPCIAPASDATADYDMDGIANGVDPCPLDGSPITSGDTDGDGIPDQCDPFPNAVDKRRCLMMFTNPSVTAKLWQPAMTTLGWDPLSDRLHADPATAVVSQVTESIEAPDASTSYTGLFVLDVDAGAGHVGALARLAGSDYRGCVVEVGLTGQVLLAYTTQDTSSAPAVDDLQPLMAPTQVGVLLTVQIVPNGASDTMQCQAIVFHGSTDSVALQTSGTSPRLPGVFALYADTWSADLDALEVLQE